MFNLLPKDTVFYDLFENIAERVVASASHLHKLTTEQASETKHATAPCPTSSAARSNPWKSSRGKNPKTKSKKPSTAAKTSAIRWNESSSKTADSAELNNERLTTDN